MDKEVFETSQLVIDFLFFIVGNAIVALLFSSLAYFPVLLHRIIFYVFSFLLSFLVLKPDVLHITLLAVKNKELIGKLKKFGSNVNRDTLSFFAQLIFRMFFFNTLYYVFPLLIVWLTSTVCFTLLEWLIISDVDLFIRVMSCAGIIFGFFQYYVKRIEEKTDKALSSWVNKIRKTVEERGSFERFLHFLEQNEDYKELRDDIIKTLKRPKKPFKFFTRAVQIELNYPLYSLLLEQSLNKYRLIEDKYRDNRSKYKLLLEAYQRFFDKAEKEAFKTLKRYLPELVRVSLVNVRFFAETYSEVFSLSSTDTTSEPETAEEFLARTIQQVAKKLLREIGIELL